MKNVLALLGICCLLIFSLSGCGGTAPEGDNNEETSMEETTGAVDSGAGEAAEPAGEESGSPMENSQDTTEDSAN